MMLSISLTGCGTETALPSDMSALLLALQGLSIPIFFIDSQCRNHPPGMALPSGAQAKRMVSFTSRFKASIFFSPQLTLPLSLPDICPVCKSSRYLNPSMRFLVNPECYHKMCESCVDRIFSQGPAPCPVAGCARTLRKQRFRKQTFEDLQIEREVDIRQRVAAM